MEEFNTDDYLAQRLKESENHNLLKKKQLLKPVLLLSGVAILVGGIWYFSSHVEEVAEDTLPLIHADYSNIKSKPQDPGGLVVAHRDKDIFDGMSNKKYKKPKEQVRHKPEAAISKEQITQTLEKQIDNKEAKEEQSEFIVNKNTASVDKEPQASTTPSEENQVSENTENNPPSNTSQDALNNTPAPVDLNTQNAIAKPEIATEHLNEKKQKAIVKEDASLPAEDDLDQLDKELSQIDQKSTTSTNDSTLTDTTTKQPSQAKTYSVRIAALKTQESAIEAWKSLKSDYNEVLGGLFSEIHQVEKDGKTIYYLHAGPIASEQTAENICKTLRERGRRCRVY